MDNENKVVNNEINNEIIGSSAENVVKDTDGDEYSIYNYIKLHPGSLAVIFSSMVAIITFFAQITAFINNKNTLEYWNIDNSYALWNSNGLLYSALTSIVYVIVVSLLTTWFSKICDAYLEQKKLFVTCKFVYKKFNQDYKDDKKVISSITHSGSISPQKLEEIKKCLKAQKENVKNIRKYTRKIEYKAKTSFVLNLLPNVCIFILLAVIRNFITLPKKELFVSTIIILVIQLIMYWLSFLIMQSTTIKKKQIKETVEEITPEYIETLGDFKKEYPILSLLKRGGKITNISFISQVIQTFLVCTFLIFSLVLIGGSEGSKRVFQIVDIDNQQYVVVFHEEETYYLEKAIIDGEKLEVYIDEQRIITTSDISFSVKTFDEIIRKQGEDTE